MDAHGPLHPDFDDIERRLQVLEREHRMRSLRCLRDEALENRLTESSIILAVDVNIRSALSMQRQTPQYPGSSWHYKVNFETL
jgi:hypothetical protein